MPAVVEDDDDESEWEDEDSEDEDESESDHTSRSPSPPPPRSQLPIPPKPHIRTHSMKKERSSSAESLVGEPSGSSSVPKVISSQTNVASQIAKELAPSTQSLSFPVAEPAHPIAAGLDHTNNGRYTQGELVILLEFHDGIFYENEAQRDTTLENALRDYAEASKKAEYKRSMAVGVREDDFLLAEHRFQKQSDESLASFASKFRSRAAFRNRGQDHRRHDQSKLLGRFEEALGLLLKSFQARLNILIDVEKGFASEFESQVSRIRDEMERVIVQTRQSLNDAFVESLREFGYDVYIAPIPKFKSPVLTESMLDSDVMDVAHAAPTVDVLSSMDRLVPEALFVSCPFLVR